jgi:hypothetical protein
MNLSRSSKLPALVLAAALGLGACSDEPLSVGKRPSAAALALEISSANAAVGSRVGVALRIDAALTPVAGIQGVLRFDPSRLEYVGQSPTAQATTIINAQGAADGGLVFTSFDVSGMQGRIANLVFEVKAPAFAQTLTYEHHKASARSEGIRSIALDVTGGVQVDATVPVPADARNFGFADWKATLAAAGRDESVALRPGDLQQVGLQFGDVNYDGSIGLDDYLAIAFAAVGLEEIIVGTDGPARDVDVVMAGNVFPDNGGTPRTCGTNGDGSRALDLDDYLGIAFFAVSLPTEPCIGQVIPGRGAAPTTRQNISGAALTVSSGTLTLTNDRIWQLDGQLRIQDGATLAIEPGTRIEGNSAVTAAAVFIERGGRIMANGTQYQPITFTCTAVPKTKACWGGVFIAGRGTVNLGDAVLGPSPDGGCNQRGGEGGGPLYGGCNPNDDSGELSYAVIEYAGFLLSANNELNCLTMAALGSATDIHHVQCHAGSDDGFEFFGGNLSTHHLVATGNDDDGFDVSFGITGDHQFVIVQADAGASNNDSKAIEADGYEGTIGPSHMPRTSPRLWNFTIIGNLALRTQNSALHLRRGSGLRLYNSIIAGYEIGVDFDDALTCDAAYGDGPVQIRHNTFIEVANLGQNDSADPLCGVATSTTEGEEEYVRGSLNNVEMLGALGTVIPTVLRDGYNTDLPDWRGVIGLGNTLAPSGGSTAVATTYRGAVEPGLGGGIPWYSGWTRPFQGATTP